MNKVIVFIFLFFGTKSVGGCGVWSVNDIESNKTIRFKIYTVQSCNDGDCRDIIRIESRKNTNRPQEFVVYKNEYKVKKKTSLYNKRDSIFWENQLIGLLRDSSIVINDKIFRIYLVKNKSFGEKSGWSMRVKVGKKLILESERVMSFFPICESQGLDYESFNQDEINYYQRRDVMFRIAFYLANMSIDEIVNKE